MISKKQHIANIQNSKLGGVKTSEGKEISKYNSMKHGIFKRLLSVDEKNEKENIESILNDEFSPKGLVEEMLIGNIANSWIRLQRAIKAEEEKIKTIINPPIIVEQWPSQIDFVVEDEGYVPIIKDEAVEALSEKYSRYIANCEYQFYKAIETFFRIRQNATQVADDK